MTDAQGPRSNARMLNDVTKTYDTTFLQILDDGMWTVYEIVKRPVAKVASRADADRLIGILKRAGDEA